MGTLLVVLVVGVAIFLLGDKPKLDVGQVVPWQIFNTNFAHNNPLNIKENPDRANPWRGQTGVDSRGLSIFDTMENGLRAGAINALGKFLKTSGLNLVDFGETYAPHLLQVPIAPYGDYGRGLGRILGVPPADPYNARTQPQLVRLLDAIIIMENSKNPLPSGMLDTAANAARLHFNL